MTKTIAVFNNKGGVGKSTICWNLGDTLARRAARSVFSAPATIDSLDATLSRACITAGVSRNDGSP